MSSQASARKRAAPAKKTVKKTTTSKKGKATVTIRHYCQGIGDCHLLCFTRDDGRPFYMLIDCGIHSSITGGPAIIEDIVADIASVTTRLDVLVVTHEHTDHVSGFLIAAETFKSIEVGEVWMGWTENPADAQARKMDAYKALALDALQGAGKALDGAVGLSDHMSGMRDSLRALIGFNFGATGDRVRAARDAAAAMAKQGVTYLEPANPPITLPKLGNLRIYVLGPPRDESMIKIGDRAGEVYPMASGQSQSMASALVNALGIDTGRTDPTYDQAAPFDGNVGTALPDALNDVSSIDPAIRAFVREHYAGPLPTKPPTSARAKKTKVDATATDQAWRRIDMDWLGMSADLAMQLDDHTNNTSLVLAFEFIDSGRVMLFAADAQIGSWLSWQDLSWGKGSKQVTGPDLLARTVYYKVSHHGSQNATLKAKGLELMTDPDLSAFIPTNEKDAKRVKWGSMPYKGIVDELMRKADGRVVRADDAWVRTGPVTARLKKASGSIKATRSKPGLWVEFDIG